MERLFGLDAQLLFELCLTGLAVFCLFMGLSFILFNPVRDMLKKRQQMVQETKDTANKEKEDALALKAEYEEKLKNAETEAEEILNTARKRALKNERAILDQAKEEAAGIIANANVQIELEKKKAMDDLKQEVVAIATMMAGKVVAASIDEKLSNQLIEDTLKEMGDDTWRS
ncbi:MAG: F0F1 ATP synthase subunit B [Lachnospiraceae bacterium]|nr:F0F1 ATP synthase subunit B [Lachnospiraceae bacterium]